MRTRAFAVLLGSAALAMSSTLVAGASGSSAVLAKPRVGFPAAGQRVQSLPYFAWSSVPGADHYQFQLSADPQFDAPVLGPYGNFLTRNTRATVAKTLPNGVYWWRVQAIAKSGAVGGWSTPRRFVKAWVAAPIARGPANGSRVAYPTPLVLSWSAVAGAATYDVSIATDPGLGSLVTSQPIHTSALSLAPAINLHVGTYFWAVTPVDAEGNKGVRSRVRSFQWAWPNVPTNLQVEDLVDSASVSDGDFGQSPESSLYVPQFRWTPVPGATRYQVEINPDLTWAAGSRVCCDERILAPVFTPTHALKSNKYYWRVRAFDADGNPGAWTPAGNGTDGDSFVKTFDNVCSAELPSNCIPAGGASIQNMRVEDWTGETATGGNVSSPVVVWDPVPGASSYEFDVTPMTNGTCDWTAPLSVHWHGTTAVAAWTPLGVRPTPVKPYPDRHPVASDNPGLIVGVHYCVRVRAQTDRDQSGSAVYGDFTTMSNAFTYAGPQSSAVASLSSGDYLAPTQGQSLRQMPVFRWRPVIGARSYWVIVAKDPSFTNIIDYAFTQAPVYAPRTATLNTTYSDESTTYYWVALPAAGANGSGASGDPVNAPHGTFQKQVPPADPQVALDEPQPVFRWKPVPGARRYELEISADQNFGSTLEKATTDSTSYTASVTYPPGKKLYWRVRADDEQLVGLSWASGTFQYHLPAPSLAGNAGYGDTIPTWRWKPVPGATSYDLHADLPNGTHRDFGGLRTAAFTATKMTGTGIFHWQVRANFPSAGGTQHGPYSRPVAFARTIKPPVDARTLGQDHALVLVWKPRTAAKQYRVQISAKPDFSSTVEQIATDNPVFAPTLASPFYVSGGTFYWHVASVDADNNTGDYSPAHAFHVKRTGRGALRR